MVESVLNSIKKLLGVSGEDSTFDTDIIIGINSALMSLQQLGLGSTNGMYITSDEDTWEDILGVRRDIEGVKLYLYHKVRLSFDPPQNSFLLESIKNQIAELEFRILVQMEGAFEENG